MAHWRARIPLFDMEGYSGFYAWNLYKINIISRAEVAIKLECSGQASAARTWHLSGVQNWMWSLTFSVPSWCLASSRSTSKFGVAISFNINSDTNATSLRSRALNRVHPPRNFIHRDVKSDNFLVWIGKRGNQVNTINSLGRWASPLQWPQVPRM